MESISTSMQILAGITIREGRKLMTGDEAIVDPEWKDRRHAQIGDTVQLFKRSFKIVGVYEPPGGGRIKIPPTTMQEQEGAEGRATAILVACSDPAKQDEVAARIQERFPGNSINIHARPSRSFTPLEFPH